MYVSVQNFQTEEKMELKIINKIKQNVKVDIIFLKQKSRSVLNLTTSPGSRKHLKSALRI